jgi:hypothetical protein
MLRKSKGFQESTHFSIYYFLFVGPVALLLISLRKAIQPV